jgi:5,8-dihydroxy-2-naphthoate synthase
MAIKPTAGKALDISLAHSPDSDDAFMFYALATGKVRTPGLKFTHVLADIETLNQEAKKEKYDVTAVSFYASAFLQKNYVLLDCGASFGDGYGPVLVALRPIKKKELAGLRVAVAGLWTTSYLALKLFEPKIVPVVVPFDKIMEAVSAGTVDAGLLIHEGQLLFQQNGLHRVVDLGQWWSKETGKPLPLGGNMIRRELGPEVGRAVARAIIQSVTYALEHREDALKYALQFARDMDPELADKFVGMYVNQWTLGFGDKGRGAVRELLARGAKAGLLPAGGAEVDFLGEAAS